MKQIKITCDTKASLPLDKIVAFQGELKTLGDKEFEKLKKSIIKYGLSFPSFVWRQNGAVKCLDGHQRSRVLQEMKKEGYQIPKIPVVYVDAKNEKEAKEKVLLLSSQYGHYSQESLYEFIEIGEIKWDEMRNFLDLPQINDDDFMKSFYSDETKINSSTLSNAQWMILVTCDNEQQQADLLNEFSQKGLSCRALIS